jgi:hypothetical protein
MNTLKEHERLLSREPPKGDQETFDKKAWQDMNARVNLVQSYCHTISDQSVSKKKQCEDDNPFGVAQVIDYVIENMCFEKVSKDTNMNLRDSSYQLSPNIEIIRKFNQALGAANECVHSTTYDAFWIKSVYASCKIDRNKMGININPKDIALWCVPDPTNKAHIYKLTLSSEIPFKLDWLKEGMLMNEPGPKVFECVYSREFDENETATFYFWAHNVPSGVRVRDQWGRAPSYRLDDEGLHGQRLAYDFREGGHYLGLETVDKCPSDLEKAIRLRG